MPYEAVSFEVLSSQAPPLILENMPRGYRVKGISSIMASIPQLLLTISTTSMSISTSG